MINIISLKGIVGILVAIIYYTAFSGELQIVPHPNECEDEFYNGILVNTDC